MQDHHLDRRTFLKASAATAAVLRARPLRAVEPEPVTIGTGPQLFLDHWLVDRTSGLQRTLHQPDKKGLIQEADGRPWQYGGARSVVRDAQQRFHMYYRLCWYDEELMRARKDSPVEGIRTLDGYATSDDGIRWQKPVLGLVDAPTGFRPTPPAKWKRGLFLEPGGWSKQNNFGCPIRSVLDLGLYGGVCDPARHYLIVADGLYFAAEMPDVVRDRAWHGKLAPIVGGKGPRGGIIGWDKDAGRWLAVGQSAGWQGSKLGRAIARWISTDLKSWSDQEIVLPVAGDESRRADDWIEYYHMGGYRVGDAWLGLLSIFHSDRSSPRYQHPTMANVWMKGTTDVRLMLSRDAGRTWQRVADTQVWLPHHAEDSGYDRCAYFCALPVRVGDELWFYYWAHDGDHAGIFKDKTPFYKDRMPIERTALATLRADGYVSLDAGKEGGRLLTRPLRLPGTRMTVNLAAPQGQLRVELQDASGKPIPGFTMTDSIPVQGDGVALPVRWRDRESIALPTGRPVRVCFELTKGSWYGFQVA